MQYVWAGSNGSSLAYVAITNGSGATLLPSFLETRWHGAVARAYGAGCGRTAICKETMRTRVLTILTPASLPTFQALASWIEDRAPVGLRFLRRGVPSFGAEEIAVIDHPWGLACGVAQFSIDLAASGAARGASIGAPAFVAEASLALLRWQGVGGALRIVVRQARLRLRVRLFDGGLAHARRGQRQLNSSKGRPRPLGVIDRALLSSLGASPGTDFRPRGHSNRRAPAAAAAAAAGLPSHFDLTSIARIPTNPSTSTTHRQRGIDPSIHSSKQQQQPWRWWGLTWAT